MAVLFSKDESNLMTSDEIWDDTALIEMYEQSIKKTYKKLGVQQGTSTSESDDQKERLKKWRMGDRCLAPYYEDNLWYPAIVKEIKPAVGMCTVVYDEYGESASVKLTDLELREDDSVVSEDSNSQKLPKFSKAHNAKKNAVRNSPSKNVSLPGSSKATLKEIRTGVLKSLATPSDTMIPGAIPPPPPMFSNIVDPNDEEAVSNMLLSWYMCGYHTGYYQALQNEKKKQNNLED